MRPQAHPKQAFADKAGAGLRLIQQLAAQRLVRSHTSFTQTVGTKGNDAKTAILDTFNARIIVAAIKESHADVDRWVITNVRHVFPPAIARLMFALYGVVSRSSGMRRVSARPILV